MMKLLRIAILFGSLASITSKENAVKNTVPDCTNRNLLGCNPTNYPDSKMTEFLDKKGPINQFLDSLISLKRQRFVQTKFENICGENQEYIFPRAARNEEGDFLFIVNAPGNSTYIQQVMVTTCTNPDTDCGG